MDTGEHIAIDTPFTEANSRYRALEGQARRLADAMIDHTAALHRTYHNGHVKWDKCRRSLCQFTQLRLRMEDIEFDSESTIGMA